ncbi:hypothetical protein DPMN_070050 [Dreissena polymorpha]|uniref:Uncharacterized protein n=1 Tax=Dreissena polymorpha TaxID=45954 RepID=A0A9D3Z5G8_DREPO|nr:hypothetical protein DPMN_070050 [Dreissena polymorpha]
MHQYKNDNGTKSGRTTGQLRYGCVSMVHYVFVMTAGSSMTAYSTLKTLANTSQPKASVTIDADGNRLTESAAV